MNANHDKLNLHFTKIPQKPCQICGQTAWLVSDKIFYLGEYENGNVVIGGPVLPVVTVTCGNCGNTVFINALVAGLLEQNKAEEQKNEQ